MKRFYKNAEAAPAGAEFTVCLDGQPIKTPGRKQFEVPTLALAKAIADEWNIQKETIDKNAMPLTRLATVAQDIIAMHRDEAVAELLGYCHTDLILHYAPEPALKPLQQAQFGPVIAWLKERYGLGVVPAQGIVPVKQPPENEGIIREAIETFDDYCLSALSILTHLTGSLYLSLYALAGKLAPAGLLEACRLEETYQAKQWGETEIHTRKAEELRSEITAASQFLLLLQP